jgi:hypothetical protein
MEPPRKKKKDRFYLFVLLFPQNRWPGVAYLGNDGITYI